MSFDGEMMSFGSLLPHPASTETLAVTIHRCEGSSIKPDYYTFIELYCTDNKCDCQRAMIRVFDTQGGLHATLSYGWQDLQFYVDWLYGDRQIAATIPGINLYTLQPQSEHAEIFLAVFREMMADQTLAKRYQQHYAQFKAALREKASLKPLTAVAQRDERKKQRRPNIKAQSALLPRQRMLKAPQP